MISVLFLMSLTACQPNSDAPIEIVPAHDLNTFYQHSDWRIFTVQSDEDPVPCSKIEQWAVSNLSSYSDKSYRLYFLKNDKALTFTGNPNLKDDFDVMLFEYNICVMSSDKKICGYCHGQLKD